MNKKGLRSYEQEPIMMNKLFLYFLVTAVLACLVLMVACSSGQRSDKVKLALDWFPNANHIGLYIAEDKGYFAEENLDVEIRTPSDPSTILMTVVSGSDDFGISYQPDVLLARGKEGDPVYVVSVLGIVQHPLNSMMTLESSGLESPAELAGKKVGYPAIEWNEHALDTMLKADGLNGVEDVELVNVGWELGSSVMSEKVSAIIGAYFTHESISLQNEGYPVDVFRMEDWGVPDYYELVLVTSAKYLSENPEIVEKFVRAVSRGYVEAIADPQAGVDILKKYSPEIDENIERPGAELLRDLWQDDQGKFGKQTEAKWRKFTEWMQDKELLDKSLDPADAFTDRYSLK